MGKVILYIAASLDGYIARTDGSVDWLEAFEAAGEDYGYAELLERVGSVIMGGSTYRQVLGFGAWPYGDFTTYVITRGKLSAPPAENIHPAAGDAPQLVARIRAESDEDIWLVGGAQINGLFRDAGLIDEIILSVMPVLLGEGIPLFPRAAGPERSLRLLSAESYPSGVVQLRYQSD